MHKNVNPIYYCTNQSEVPDGKYHGVWQNEYIGFEVQGRQAIIMSHDHHTQGASVNVLIIIKDGKVYVYDHSQTQVQ